MRSARAPRASEAWRAGTVARGLAWWLLALAAVASVSLALGALLPVDRFTPLFVAGALLVLASIGFLRTGQDRPLAWSAPGGRLFWLPSPFVGPSGEGGAAHGTALGVGLLALGLACWGLIFALRRLGW